MSGNLTAVSEMSDFTKSRGKNLVREKWPKNCVLSAAHLHPFLTLLRLCISFWFKIMHCCIPTPPLTITLVQAWYE